MSAIASIFIVVVSAAIGLILNGVLEVFVYLINKSKKSNNMKRILVVLCSIAILAIVLIIVFGGMMYLTNLICSTTLGNYIAVLVYTTLLSVMAADIYISPTVDIDSISKAFKRGFTKASVNHIIPNLYIKTIINLFYLIVLILAQIEDLGLATFSSSVSYFCTLNKYGIVIVFAIEKIIKSLAPERKRTKILTEAFMEQEKKEEREREERKTMRASIKKQKMAKKQAKKERKNNK